MKKIILILTSMVCICSSVLAQNTTIDELIDKGTEQHDKGEYIAALTYYRQALKIDSNEMRANYEMANTLIAMEKYPDAIRFSDKVIGGGKLFVDKAYTLKGTALDMMSKPYEALEVYLEGLKKFPKDYLLRYNTAMVYLNQKRYPDAEYHATKALEANINHSSSHLVLAYAMYFQNGRAQSIMSLFYYLLLENDTKRSGGALKMLHSQMGEGVTKGGDNQINISLNTAEGKDEFSAAELSLSMMRALRYDAKNIDKTELELFAEESKTFFAIMGELKNKKKNIWWDVYVPFFRDLNKQNHTEALCYYISQAANDKAAEAWVAAHKSKVEQLIAWYNKRQPK